MPVSLSFDQIRLPPECEALRRAVRAFIAEEVAAGSFDPERPGDGDQHSKELSRRIGAKGWIGMTWPKKYGGRARRVLPRHVGDEGGFGAHTPRRPHLRAERPNGRVPL